MQVMADGVVLGREDTVGNGWYVEQLTLWKRYVKDEDCMAERGRHIDEGMNTCVEGMDFHWKFC